MWRKPNRRYKVSRDVLRKRLRATWLNSIRVRRLAQQTLGIDLASAMYGIDEKPMHFNESGSKNVNTLEIAGVKAVRLKTNHAASRERVSVMTCVTSDPLVASRPSKPPLEILFRAKSKRRTAKLSVPDDTSVSLSWAVKGSYRQEHILQYLKRWLDPWTPEREAAQDYRILFLDIASSHIGNEITEYAWSFGYITLYHYGGTTGVTQVNDTDNHADFEKDFWNKNKMLSMSSNFTTQGISGERPPM